MKIHHYLLAFLLFSFAFEANGSHLMGGNVTYTFIGYNSNTNLYTYKITAKIYRYCDSTGTGGTPAALDNQMTTGIYPQNPFLPNANKSLYTTLTLPLLSANYIVPPSNNPNCTVGSNVCVQEGVYQNTINLPPSTGGYHLIIDRCCRNYNIANLNVAAPPGAGECFYAFVPPTSTPNNSPTFATAPVPYLCVSDTVSVLNSAFDADGDSLAYSFQTPYNGISSSNNAIPNPPATYTWPIANCTYAAGYSVSNPFGNGGYASINSSTGLTSYYIPTQGFYVVAVEIKEYRNGVLIGITRRDIQLIVIPCTPNTSPSVSASTTNTIFNVDAGEQLCFPIEYTDADGDSLYITANGPIFDSTVTNPAASFNNSAGAGLATSQFCWNTPCVSSASSFQFIATALDNGCPPKTSNTVYTINVNPVNISGLSGSDTVCAGQGSSTYSVNPGAASYHWIVSGGTINGPSNGSSVDIDWTSGSGSVAVYATNAYGCQSDTLSQQIISYQPMVQAGPDVAFCEGGSAVIGGMNMAGQTYSWSPSAGLSDSTSSNPDVTLSTPGTTVYEVTTNLNGCLATDQVSVTVYANPVITLSNIPAICASASPFTLNSASPSGGIYSGTGVSNDMFDPAISGAGTFTIDYSYTDLNQCSSTASTSITVNPDPVVTLSNISSACINSSPITLTGGSPTGGTYSGTGVSNGIFDPAGLPQGSYPITYDYTDSLGCSGTATANISVGVAPSVSISASQGISCANNTIYIGYGPQNITLTATASNSGLFYQWYLDGNIITGAADSVYLASTGGNYSVVVNDGNGCASLPDDSASNITISAIDVRCGQNMQKIVICHVPPGNTGNPQTLCIAPSAVPAHLSLHPEDCLGPCPSVRVNSNAAVEANALNIYPNPFTNSIHLSFIAFEDQQIEATVYDMEGRLMDRLFRGEFKSDTHFDREFDLSALEKGVYIIQFVAGDITEYRKITNCK